MKKILLMLLIAGTAHAQLEQNVKLRQFNISITGTPTLVTTPIDVNIKSGSVSVSISAGSPTATTAIFGYGDTGSSYNPVQWPYMFNLYAQRMMIKPGESFFIRVSGTSSSGIVYGFVLYSEQ